MPSNTVTGEMLCTWAIWHDGAVSAVSSSVRAVVPPLHYSSIFLTIHSRCGNPSIASCAVQQLGSISPHLCVTLCCTHTLTQGWKGGGKQQIKIGQDFCEDW